MYFLLWVVYDFVHFLWMFHGFLLFMSGLWFSSFLLVVVYVLGLFPFYECCMISLFLWMVHGVFYELFMVSFFLRVVYDFTLFLWVVYGFLPFNEWFMVLLFVWVVYGVMSELWYDLCIMLCLRRFRQILLQVVCRRSLHATARSGSTNRRPGAAERQSMLLITQSENSIVLIPNTNLAHV